MRYLPLLGQNYLSHKLLVAKLNAYGFDETSLKVNISYLRNCTKTTKADSSFSELVNKIYGIPQGSIHGPLLFIIYVCDLFIVRKDVSFFWLCRWYHPFYYWHEIWTNYSWIRKPFLSDISQWFMNINLKPNDLWISI